MIHSVGTATRLRLWTFDGLKKLHEMLAEIGYVYVNYIGIRDPQKWSMGSSGSLGYDVY